MPRLRLILLLVCIPLLAACLAIIWLCYTAAGLQFALLQLNHLPALSVQVRGVSGRLAGPLHVDHITLDHERVQIEIEQLDVDLTPAYLLSGLIEINHFRVKQLSATLKPRRHDTPEQPSHFLPAFLRISVDELQLQQARYLHTNGYRLIATPLQASVALSRNRLKVTQLNVITQEFAARGAVSLDAGAVLTLAANLDADYTLANGPVLRGTITATGAVTGPNRELNMNTLLREPHAASIDALLAFPDSGWSMQGKALADKVLLDAWWQQPTFSLRKLAMQFKLSEQGMHYAGEVIVPEWGAAPLQVSADTHYAQRVFTLERVAVSTSAGTRTSTAGTITLQSNAKPLLDLRSSWTNLQWPLQVVRSAALFTSSEGRMTLKGTQPYAFDMSGRVALPQWPESAIQASGELRAGEINIANYTVNTLQGTATGSALVGLNKEQRWQLALNARNLNPAELQVAWPGNLNINANAQGRGFNTHAQFDLHLQSLQGSLRNQAIKAKGRLQRIAQGWLAEGIDATWGRAHLSAQGALGSQNNLRWNLAAPVLRQLHPDLTGDLTMTGEFSGPENAAQLSLKAQAGHVSYLAWQADNLKLDTNLDPTDRTQSRMNLTANRLAYGELELHSVQLTGDGQSSAHQLRLQATPVQALLPKNMQLELQMAGAYVDQRWRGKLAALRVIDAQQALRLSLVQPATLLLAKNQAQLQSFCIVVDNGRACADADWFKDAAHGTRWSTHLSLQDLPLSISNSAMDNTRLQAQVNGQLDLSAAAGLPWQGGGQLQLHDAGIRYRSLTGREQVLPITLGEVHMTADAQAVQTSAELRLGEQTVSTLSARLDRSVGQGLDSWPLSGVLGLSSSDAKLIPVFVNDVDRAAGTLAAVMQLSGTAADPHFSGSLRLLQGELDFYQLNLAMRSLELDAQLDSEQLHFTAQGNVGEGALHANGDLSWRDAKLFGNLQLKGDRLLVADLPEYRVLATPEMRFDIDDRNIHVKGEVLIPEARLQPKEVVGAVQTSADARFKSDKVMERGSNWLIDSDVTIRLGDSVNFDGLGLQGRLNGLINTRLRTGEVAVGSGELSISNGRYEAYGRKLDIMRGRLIYDTSPLTDPGLDIQAERKINDITVGVNVRGVLRSPRLQFYSDPAMTQTQIVSYLLVGKPLDELQGQEATTVRSASNTLAVQGGGYLAAQLGRRIGLEEVGVETDANNQSALVLGKFLSPRLFISYGISLAEAINTIKLRYTLTDHWTLKTEAGAAKSADIEFKIER